MKKRLSLLLSFTFVFSFFFGLTAFTTSAEARTRTLILKGYLYYKNGARGKSFRWTLTYNPYKRYGYNCYGSVRDRDGLATFNGTYNARTGSFRLVKHYFGRRRGRSYFYYRGYMRGGKVSGSAHFSSYYGRRYAGWSARIIWRNNYRRRSQKLYLRGYLRYYARGGKSFRWKLTYYPDTGVCRGYVRDRDGYATFTGTYNPRTNKFRMIKDFIYRKSGMRRFYYTGYVDRRGVYRGTARKHSFWGRAYGSWTARRR